MVRRSKKMNLLDVMEQDKLSFEDVKKVLNEKLKQEEYEEYSDKMRTLFMYFLKTSAELLRSIYVSPSEDIIGEYIEKWCNYFINGRNNPTLKKALKNYGEKDEALIARVKSVTKASDEKMTDYIEGHFLFMSAENNNGLILEEYLAHVLEKYGWIWCSGETVKAIDFVYLNEDKNESILLQIKNKYNTENSSSSAIRKGTEIIKWNRLNKPIKTDKSKPISNWEKLREIVNLYTPEACEELTEEKYLEYIKNNSGEDIETL